MAGRIAQLPQEVVDKIAAGEVVVRPVNAVKELLENSLDAGSTEITISINGGGLGLIRIQDNGHGIAKGDLALACCRFATSKLTAYEDLRQIGTYGFRGEALASISCVANLTITTRTGEDKCAHRAVYRDGQMIGKIGQSAGLPGTVICAEKLFHSLPHRLASIRQPAEEANRIADLIVRYAIHYPHVAFAYRRLDGTGYDFRSTGKGDQHGTIRALMHAKATKDLINIEFGDPALHFTAKVCMCTPATVFTSRAVQARHDKFKIFHLFINGRSVDCPRLQRTFDAVFIAKDAFCPFATLSLEIDPTRVDVNVHPTKAIVHFVDEDRIIERIGQEMCTFLTEHRTRGTMRMDDTTMMMMPGVMEGGGIENGGRKRKATPFTTDEASLSSPKSGQQNGRPTTSTSTTPKQSKMAAKDMVRVDYTNRSMDEFLLTREDLDNPLRSIPSSSSHLGMMEEEWDLEEDGEGNAHNPIELNDDDAMEEHINAAAISPTINFDLNSLVELRREICRDVDQELAELFKRHILIGFFDSRRALFQSDSRVYLVDSGHVLCQFFYQLVIFSLGSMAPFDLLVRSSTSTTSGAPSNFLPIRRLLRLHLDDPQNDDGEEEMEEQIERHCQVLVHYRTMLCDLFSIKILPNAQKEGAPSSPVLASIPSLIDGYMPQLEALPHFLFQLGQVDYGNEKQCYTGIAMALAELYVPFMEGEEEEEEDDDRKGEEEKDMEEEEEKKKGEEDERKLDCKRTQRVLRALVFPALRNRFLPGHGLREHCQMLTSTAQAFKHFGRC